MAQQVESSQMHDLIREYLCYWELNSSVELHELELKAKPQNSLKRACKLDQLLRCSQIKSNDELELQRKNKIYTKKYQEVLQAGRQIFSVAINLLQVITNIKEGNDKKYSSTNDAVDNFKVQLGKHHKVIINEGRVEGAELISGTIIKDHKAKLEQQFKQNNIDGVVEMLLSLRVNALQIAPELRKTLVEEFIRRDIFKISELQSFEFLLEILNKSQKQLRHAITSLISVIVSTLRGIDYLTYNGSDLIITKIIKILKQQENGNVTQRFCLAILQKCSVKQLVIKTYLDNEMINWVISLVKKSFNTKIHMFCLDFATAMLANLIHSLPCQLFLEKKPELVVYVMQNILKLIREALEVSVLMHLLITLSYLCRDRFKRQMDEVNIVKKISDFVDYYERSSSKNEDGEAAEMDKRTVLDLCAHMFHPKEDNFDTQKRIKEYENEQGELIFECFQDEVS